MLTPSAVDSNHESVTDSDQQYVARLQRMSSGHEHVSRHSMDSAGSSSTDYAEILTELKDLDAQDPLANDWRADPYGIDPELATHYIEAYFTFINDRLYYMFPRRRFLLWLRSCHTKSLDDNMLLYSMMTLGSVFSDRPDRMTALKRYSRTARYALEHNQHRLSLQLAQSRIIMSLWYYAIGALVKSWDAAGAAVRTVCGLRYNVEMGGVIVEQSQQCEYGLHPQALIECRRRTFWTAFLMDVGRPPNPTTASRISLTWICLAPLMLLCTVDNLHFFPDRIPQTAVSGRDLRSPRVYDRAILPALLEPASSIPGR
jgi:hypothetical protein